MKVLNWDVDEAQTGYRPFTTLFEDFSIADVFGVGEELQYFYDITD